MKVSFLLSNYPKREALGRANGACYVGRKLWRAIKAVWEKLLETKARGAEYVTSMVWQTIELSGESW